MQLTGKMIEEMVRRSTRRAESAVAVGGISEQERCQGQEVPKGWKLDWDTLYWLPPNLTLLNH